MSALPDYSLAPVTSAGTTLPWSKSLEEQFTFEDRFEEMVQVFQTSIDGNTIEVPRAGVPLGLDQRDPGIAVNFTSQFQPQKPEQLSVIAQTVELLTQDHGVIVSAPTGWGKTFVGAEIAGRMGRRFCVITTKEDIIGQWVDAIRKTLSLEEHEVGIWRGDHTPKPTHKAVVCLVQSVMKGPARYGIDAYLNFGLVLCDEVHRMGAESFSRAMWHFPSKYRVGMSATPERKDGRDRVFKWHIGTAMVAATQEVMIPKILTHRTPWKLPRDSKGQQIPHDFGHISPILKAMARNPPRNALILEYVKALLEAGRSTIAFAETLEHLQIVHGLALAAGLDEKHFGFYVGVPSDVYQWNKLIKTPKKVQLQMRDQHKARPFLYATYSMASEATNIPWADTCLMMSPRADVEQIVGRIRREYPDKKEPVVIDLVDADSLVLREYANKRLRWYRSLQARVVPYG